MKGAAGCSHPGVVTGVRAHHSNPKYAVVEVAHGRKSPPKKGNTDPFPYDDRPTSSMVIPKAHASKFPVGRRVTPSLAPAADDDGDLGEDLNQMQARLKRSRRGRLGG